MKMSNTNSILTGALLLLALGLKAQNRDYVIKANSDTLKGQFIGKKFKADGRDKADRLDPTEYKETYHAANHDLERRVLMRSGSDAVFLPVIINGKISLYEKVISHWIPGAYPMTQIYSGTIQLYVAKNTDTVKELDYSQIPNLNFVPKKKRMDVLGPMLMDNKVIYNKFISDDNFNIKQIKNIIHLYDTGRPLGSDVTGDYVIKNNKDTIFCEVEPATMSTMGRYRISEQDKFFKIDTSITEYFFSDNSSTYLLKNLPKNSRRQYVKLLIKGRINLYSYSSNNSTADSEASLYAAKETGDMIQIKHSFSRPGKSEKKALADLISNDPSLVEKLESLSYDFTSIFTFINTYNSDYLNTSKPAK